MAKLLETGLNNLHRARVLWKPLTAHLLEVGLIFLTLQIIQFTVRKEVQYQKIHFFDSLTFDTITAPLSSDCSRDLHVTIRGNRMKSFV